ncbi:MAG: RNA-binding transcriptional accessory protein, partial [Chthoniobacterales bacterium]|nr:RNA-binding transcriptional accessory protein [Chthoniobacterales bacterium]
MKEDHIIQIAASLNLHPRQVAATAILLAEGATVPFIARYRKERTGELNELQITAIRDEITRLEQLDNRRLAILDSLRQRNLLTDELSLQISNAKTLASLEDLYQPYRPKRRTRAAIARERGLEPLADLLWQQHPSLDPASEAINFVNPEKEITDSDSALAGARDILAERINDDPTARSQLRQLFLEKSTLRSKVIEGKEAEAAKYRDYFDWSEPAHSAPSHRILAIRRGEAEGFLICRITPPEEEALYILRHLFLKGSTPSSNQVAMAIEDAYRRLLSHSLEAEARIHFKQKADEDAIRIFAQNLRELLLSPPLGQKTVLAIDPGFRTGSKIAILNPQGKLLNHDIIYPDRSPADRSLAAQK